MCGAVGTFGRNLQIFERIANMKEYLQKMVALLKYTGKIKKNTEIWK